MDDKNNIFSLPLITELDLRHAQKLRDMASASAEYQRKVGMTAQQQPAPPWAQPYPQPGLWPSTNGAITIGNIPAPPPKDEGYWRKLAEDMANIASRAQSNIQQLQHEVNNNKKDVEAYDKLRMWLLTNHREVVDEFMLYLRAIDRLDLNEGADEV